MQWSFFNFLMFLVANSIHQQAKTSSKTSNGSIVAVEQQNNNNSNNIRHNNITFNTFINPQNHHEISIFTRYPFEPLSNHRTKSFHGYDLFFQADRHTKFYLHTAAVTRASDKPKLKDNEPNKSSTKFGFGKPIETVWGGVDMRLTRTEEVKLYDAASLRKSHFDPFNPTRILIHGWMGGSRAGVYTTLVPTYLRLDSCRLFNIFTVDWGRGAVADYLSASYRVKAVGRALAKFIDFLHREAGARFADIHLVGFSMGAHVAGIAGKSVRSGRIAVIHALDPALPFFRYDSRDERIAAHDADYVQVLHTNAGAYGYDRPLGHVDFYVNFGRHQPGCFLNECSHVRAFHVFAESLWREEAFVGEECDQRLWEELLRKRMCTRRTKQRLAMGGDLGTQSSDELKQRRGVFYVTTTEGRGKGGKRVKL